MTNPKARHAHQSRAEKRTRRRLQIELTEAAYSRLETLRVKTGEPSLVSVVRSALRVYGWVVDEQAAGSSIIALDSANADALDWKHKELVSLV